MSQSRLHSFFEANINTFVGFAMSMVVWEFVVKPLWGFSTSFLDNLGITCIFTVLSIARGYFIRRYFNRKTHAARRV
jgi:low affinity Fe/Cu permease